jgi:hypothetical protein
MKHPGGRGGRPLIIPQHQALKKPLLRALVENDAGLSLAEFLDAL